jgi:hypothetical protein
MFYYQTITHYIQTYTESAAKKKGLGSGFNTDKGQTPLEINFFKINFFREKEIAAVFLIIKSSNFHPASSIARKILLAEYLATLYSMFGVSEYFVTLQGSRWASLGSNFSSY